MNKDISPFAIDIDKLPSVDANEFDNSRTAVVVVDVINGFLNFGALADNSINIIVDRINALLTLLPQSDRVSVRDSHTLDSRELTIFPIHCTGGRESQLVDNLSHCFNVDIEKNSTNAFYKFKPLYETREYKNIIIAGDCSDLCIMHFAISLVTYINEYNHNSNVYLVANAIDTFDTPTHPKQQLNEISLYLMREAGVNLLKI
ncbi:MAG: isochorismatase family protein [Clostridia bacterium]